MNFLETIFHNLTRTPARPALGEVRDARIVSVTCADLLASVRAARGFLLKAGLHKGDRCALLAHNSIRWVALDLALMAEGIVVVPLYARQASAELVAMMKDSSPSLICCGDAALREAIARLWPEAPRMVLFDEVFAATSSIASDSPLPRSDTDIVTIIYTSGTSGVAKGVILNTANLNHMLPCTIARLGLLMGPKPEPDRVFHYLPFCFAGSWILLLTCLSRASVLTLSTDLARLAEEMKLAAPDYFLNVPALLERVKTGIEEQLRKRGGPVRTIFEKARDAWLRRQAGHPLGLSSLWLALGRALVFPAIRKKLGPNLKALICGSAPLAKETQLFFMMLGLPVLQVYGLTETTAICTLDHPRRIEPGRVGPAIPGVEMKLGESDEVLVRGPNVFPGYWNRPEETARTIRNGWLHTGDQGEVNDSGNWRILGRVKNLIVLSSGHNVPPEPLEDALVRSAPGAQQAMLVGHGRSHLAALITGPVTREQVAAALDALNAHLPHYRRIHSFHICAEAFTIENGFLTANGKMKREAIAARYATQIDEMYRKKEA